MELDTTAHMNALDYLRTLPANSVHCCVTSPPYYGLRNYGADGQIGLEDTPAAFVARLVDIFEDVRRVLRDDGVCWVNLGDSYSSGGRTTQVTQTLRDGQNGTDRRVPPGELAGKQLLGIPWRVAFALQDAGWWLRNDIVWEKPNPMPESVTDRCTKSHEYVFLLSKSAQYWMDMDAIREGGSVNSHGGGERRQDRWHTQVHGETAHAGLAKTFPAGANGRNKRTVWTVATEPSSLPHFAMFPQALIEPMILAGCPATVCSECGVGYVRDVEDTPEYAAVKQSMIGKTHEDISLELERGKQQGWGKGKARVTKAQVTIGFSPSCACNANQDAGTVIDPFMGTGTTALVAQKHGRHWIGCDVNAETVELANDRTRYHGDDKRMLKEQSAGVEQLDMFNK